MCLAEFEGFAQLVALASVTLFFPRSWRRSRPGPFSVSVFSNCVAFWFVKSLVFLCFTLKILVSPWLLTWLANYKRASRSDARPVLLKFHFVIEFFSCSLEVWLFGTENISFRLVIRILSSRAESISHSFASLTLERYFQHEKIKFVSPRGHVISSICVIALNIFFSSTVL